MFKPIKILSARISTGIRLFIRPSRFAVFGSPSLAFGNDATDALDPADVQDWGNKDVNRLQGNITKALARSAPYLDILEGGTIAAGVSTDVRAVVQERAYLNDSLTNPTFTDDISIAGTVGEAAEVGSKEYTYRLRTKRGMGPLVNVKVMRDAFQGGYAIAEDSLKKQIIQFNNADVRATLVNKSGVKLVCHTGKSFDQMCDGDVQAIDTAFPILDGAGPNASLSFTLLQGLGRRMREDFLVEPFESKDSEPLLKFIGGQEILDVLRDNLNVRADHQYLAAGAYKVGQTTLTKYRWEGPYRGWAFGVDSQPLRFSYVDETGQPVYIEPEIRVETSRGVCGRPNPAWIRARYEIAIALGANSFRRLAPAQYTGEGSFKFPSQLSMGEMIWRVIQDNGNNVWGDYGRHFFQISRAIKPERTQAVCAIAFKRPVIDYGLSAQADYSDYSSSAAI